ncbi:MAG: Uma2 family endonuclease [Gemmatimonadales bacterium]
MSDAAHLMTADQLFRYPDRERYELVRGVPRICEPPGGVHGRLAARIAARLSDHVERHGLGTVLIESGYLLRRNPDTVRGPDVSFISGTRLTPDQIPDQFIPGAPDLAVEILSPSSRWPEVEETLADYFASGARMVWLVEPQQRRVTLRYPDRPPRVVAVGDALEGEDVVPGFRMTTTDLFGRT